MIDLLGAPGSLPFSVALLVMLGLLLVELLALVGGFGVSELFDDLVVSNVDLPEVDVDVDADLSSGLEGSGAPDGGSTLGRVLAWLYIGRVPVLMVLIIFLTVFGLAGLMAQALLRQLIGMSAPAILAGPAVFVLVLPLVRACTAGLAWLMPKEESSAVSTDTFIGRTAIVTGGSARTGMPAQARLTDRFGTTHYVLVEPDNSDEVLQSGETVLLVRRMGSRFGAIPNPNADLVDPRRH